MPTSSRPASAEQALQEAVDWMILLQCPTPAQCQAFDAWLAEDARHLDAYAQVSAAWSAPEMETAASRLAAPPPTPLPKPRKARVSGLPWRRLALAAVLVLGVAALVKLPLRLEADHMTGIGERQHFNLADGTEVVLNTESALAAQAGPNARAAQLLQGEAWFDVPSRGAPLELRAGSLLAQANGSAFTVRWLDGQARVHVQRGRVDLRSNQHESLSLSAGMSVGLGRSGFEAPTRLQPEQDLAWLNGRLVFVNRPLREVLADLSRYYPGWILNTRASLDERRVTGNYSVEDPPAVVRALAQVTSASLREWPALMILN